MADMIPTLGAITRDNGVAGQYALSVRVTYPDNPETLVTFVGSKYGGRVVMVLPGNFQTFVSRDVMERCGDMLTDEWVRAFFRMRGDDDA